MGNLHIYNLKKEGNVVICENIDEPRRYQAKPITEEQIPDLTHIKNRNQHYS